MVHYIFQDLIVLEYVSVRQYTRAFIKAYTTILNTKRLMKNNKYVS